LGCESHRLLVSRHVKSSCDGAIWDTVAVAFAHPTLDTTRASFVQLRHERGWGERVAVRQVSKHQCWPMAAGEADVGMQTIQGDREVIPLSQRPADIAIVAFFLVNLLFITYVVDLEQLVIANPAHFVYPLWPPRPAVDAIHWWGRTFDHLEDARPVWWKMTIWIDDLLYGPFYAVAIYAFVKGKEWIRIPSVFYAGMLFATVVIILGEEKAGPYASPNFAMVLLANLPWLLFPIVIAVRIWRGGETPFTRAAAAMALPIGSSVGPTGRVSGTGGA